MTFIWGSPKMKKSMRRDFRAVSGMRAGPQKGENMENTKERPVISAKLILTVGVLCASMSSVFFRYMTAPSNITATYRLGWTVILLTPLVMARHRRELFSMKIRELLWCAAAGVFLALHFYVWFESLLLTSIASSTVLVCTEVVFAAFGYLLFFGRKIGPMEVAAIGIALVGSIVIAAADGGGDQGKDAFRGDLLALAAAGFSACYTLIGTRQRGHMSTTVYTYVLYWSSFLTLLVLDLISGTPVFGYEKADWIMSLCLAVFCTLLGHSIFSWSLKYLSPTYVSTVKLAEPVFAAAAALFLFQEVPGILQLSGGIIVLAGVWLYTKHA